MLALTGVAVMSFGGQVAPEYEAEASAMIAPERAEPQVANPYGSITGANDALGIVLNSVDTRRTIMEQGLAPSYEIGAQSRSTILQMAIRADSPDVALATGQAVLDIAALELSTRQTEAGLPPEAQYTLAVLAPPAVTAVVETGAVRVQAVVGVLGAGLSLLVAVLFDDIVGLWRRGREKRRASGRRQVVGAAAPATEAPTEDDSAELPRAERVDRVSRAGSSGAELPRRSKSRAKSQRQTAAKREPAEQTERANSKDLNGGENADAESLRRSGWIGPSADRSRKVEAEPRRSDTPAPDDDATAEMSTADIRAAEAGTPTSSGAARH